MTMHKQIVADVLEINRRLCLDLWHMTSVNERNQAFSPDIPKLIIPPYRDNKVRISEQEARFLMCSILNDFDYFYSIETPTTLLYSFSGENKRSAATDLTLWLHNGDTFERAVNIEFKARNRSKNYIIKDIEKLVSEGTIGNWFHLLKNIDRGTLKSLFSKFVEGLEETSHKGLSTKKEIVFTFCVLEKKWACQKILTPVDDFKSFFTLEYHIEREQVIVTNDNGWYFLNPQTEHVRK